MTATGQISEDATIQKHIDGLRGIQVPKEKEQFKELNARMDAAWKFIGAHQKTALPIVEAELKEALNEKVPDQFFLLDMGYLLLTHRAEKAATLAEAALEQLDPQVEVVQANWEEVFHFTMKLGASGVEAERYLKQLDRMFLGSDSKITFFRAPHVVKLDPLDVGCMVYGVAGESAAQHLAERLSGFKGQSLERSLQILEGIGSEANVPAVKAIMDTARDYETFSACLTFMMELGGPSGRAAVLKLDAANLDAKSQAYYQKIRPEVEKVNFAAMTVVLEKSDDARASDSKLQRLLDTMEKNDGEDNETPPAAIAKSGIPTARLLAQLKRIRARSFRRETNHVIEDLQITNFLINTLQFKPAKS